MPNREGTLDMAGRNPASQEHNIFKINILFWFLCSMLAVMPVRGEAGTPAAAGVETPPVSVWLAAASKQRCVKTRKRGGRSTLINSCRECRSVSLQHKRPGSGFPVARSYSVPASSEIQLSFRGSGATRILSDRPCRDKSTSQGADNERDCAHLLKRKSGNVLLVNACKRCRAVSIERVATSGRRERKVFALTPRSHMTLARQGAAQIRIVADKACPR